MPPGGRPHGPLTRADLPAELTADAVRQLDTSVVRRLARPGNGILDEDEERRFHEALREVMRDTTDRLERSLGRPRRGEGLDPQLRRSLARTEQRLAAQARRAGWTFPQLPEAPVDDPVEEPDSGVSLGALETELEQTSDLLDVLERIASVEQQQLEHHRAQAVRDVRSVFFGFVVSVAVIVAGVAPLMQASSHDRTLILGWTLGIIAAAAAVYAIVRAVQSKGADGDA